MTELRLGTEGVGASRGNASMKNQRGLLATIALTAPFLHGSLLYAADESAEASRQGSMNADLVAIYAAAEVSATPLVFEPISASDAGALLKGIDVPEQIDFSNPDDRSQDVVHEIVKPVYSLAQYDLNNDGVYEIFLYRSGPAMCGSAGCGLDVYMRKADGSYYLVADWITDTHIKASQTTHHGFHDLAFLLSWPANGLNYVFWEWDGVGYVCKTCPRR